MPTECSKCRRQLRGNDAYHDQRTVLCEACYMENRKQYARKTHWRYIRSIKADYLQPVKR